MSAFNNAAAAMKLMAAKNQFENTHPRVIAFFRDMLSRGVEAGSVIEISVTGPDGTKTTTNMKVQPSDLELVEELKNMARQQQ